MDCLTTPTKSTFNASLKKVDFNRDLATFKVPELIKIPAELNAVCWMMDTVYTFTRNDMRLIAEFAETPMTEIINGEDRKVFVRDILHILCVYVLLGKKEDLIKLCTEGATVKSVLLQMAEDYCAFRDTTVEVAAENWAELLRDEESAKVEADAIKAAELNKIQMRAKRSEADAELNETLQAVADEEESEAAGCYEGEGAADAEIKPKKKYKINRVTGHFFYSTGTGWTEIQCDTLRGAKISAARSASNTVKGGVIVAKRENGKMVPMFVKESHGCEWEEVKPEDTEVYINPVNFFGSSSEAPTEDTPAAA